ncbi:MAG: MerR family transcriptional regulator [Terriglobia bacterium]
MKDTTARLYQAHEFAERVRVTVRTLHHYDHLGILKPSGRTASGYRLYSERDFARLEQIVALKFIGFSLKQITDLLNRKAFDLPAALRLQSTILKEKRRHLDLAIQAIERAKRLVTSRASSREPDWEAFRKIIEVINMQQNAEWMKKYYTEDARQDLAGRGTPEVIEQGQRDWAALIKEVEAAAAAGVDPASERAEGLARRWQTLIDAFTGGSAAVAAGLKKLYADESNWPPTFKKPYTDEVGAFICRAVEAHKQGKQ